MTDDAKRRFDMPSPIRRPGRPPKIAFQSQNQENSTSPEFLHAATDTNERTLAPNEIIAPRQEQTGEAKNAEPVAFDKGAAKFSSTDRDLKFAEEEAQKAEELAKKKVKFEERRQRAQEKAKNARERARTVNKRLEKQSRFSSVSKKMIWAKLLAGMMSDPEYEKTKLAFDEYLSRRQNPEAVLLKKFYGEELSVKLMIRVLSE